LIQAVKEGILSVDPTAQFSTHTALPFKPALNVAYFDAMIDNGYNPDQLGISAYPSENYLQSGVTDRMTKIKSLISQLYTTFAKPVFIAEFAYPSTTPTEEFSGYNYVDGSYSHTPRGQYNYIYDLTYWGRVNGLIGIRCWAPDLIIDDYLSLSLFSEADDSYAAKIAIDAISNGLEAPLPVQFETENLTVTMSSGDTHTTTSNLNMSGGYGDMFNANATNDYIQYTVNVPEPGTYNIKYRVNKYNNRGKYQLIIDGTNQGTEQNLYSSISTYVEIDLGNKTFSTAGNKLFRFKCTGRYWYSSGYKLFTDYIKLIPQ